MKMILLQTIIFSFIISCEPSNKEEAVEIPNLNEQPRTSGKEEPAVDFDDYIISNEGYDIFFISKGTQENYDAVAYFYNHFKKRTPTGTVLMQGLDPVPAVNSKVQFIEVKIDPGLGSDYSIQKEKNKLILQANSRKTLYWLFYQYFQDLSEADSKVNGADLPPAIVSFDLSKKVNFAFNYRDPHLKANLEKDYDVIVNTNNVEKDWGIWGHQLFNLVNKKPKDAYYSVVNGKLNKNQICFSNTATQSFLENYIIDNFGEDAKYKQNFVISPADNALVCTCDSCSKLGNTKGNASPAVIALVNKMATRFPNHQFFTIDYITVQTPPKTSMPENTGVIISSIDIPRKVKLDRNNRQIREFEAKVKNWKRVCPTIYVWDYISNFDDYLTPYPSLSVSKATFDFYKSLQISGIFANGAGYEYSTFHALHTYVLAALMQDPTLDINQLVSRYCKFYYGKSGELVADYVIGLERVMQAKNIRLNLYSGIDKITGAYLDKGNFFKFYDTVDKIKNTDEAEFAFRMNQLHTGLTYSAMQIQLANKFDKPYGLATQKANVIEINDDFREKYQTFLERFKTYDILVTRERGGSVSAYLKDVRTELIDEKLRTNLLNNNTLKVTSQLDEDYKDTSILTDGIPGLATNYHTGWMFVSAPNLTAEINIPNEDGRLEFQLNFLIDERLRLRAPEKVEFIVNDKIVKTIQPTTEVSESATRLSLKTTLIFNLDAEIKIKVYPDKTYKKFAIDEIYL